MKFMERDKKIKVAISHGDVNGIGYEILWKIFAEERILELMTPVIYGSQKAMRYWKEELGIEAKDWSLIARAEDAIDGQVNLIDCIGETVHITPGKASSDAGYWAFIALERAVNDTLAKHCDVLVTAPINKSTMPQDLFPYKGHTQYLEAKAATTQGQSLMLLSSQDCRVSLVTGHIPISEVAQHITTSLIIDKAHMLDASLRRDFSIIKPRIAVLALNPHAGDQGLIGTEEIDVIIPAIEQLKAEGILAFGPYPADGFWASDQYTAFDGVLAMYHDQGLAPFKTLYMSDGVNTTLGLNIVRTSPDHGTAYGIVGQRKASADSMRMAIYQAIDIYRARTTYDYATRNPLRRVYFNKGKDDDTLDLATIVEHND